MNASETMAPPVEKQVNTRPTLKSRFFYNLKRLPAWVVIKILITAGLLAPWFIYYLSVSWFKVLYWKSVETCRRFIKRQKLAFPGVEESSLQISSMSGGVSNASHVWKMLTQTGEEKKYYAKVFIPSGSIWIKQMSLISPFPSVYAIHTAERFTVDIVSRVQLGDKNIPVPKLVAYDPVHKVIVTEYLEGQNVDSVLCQIAQRRTVETEDEMMIQQCGVLLAKIHNAGFSLIDCQPANCLWIPKEKKVYFTDLEFCTREDWRLWDIGFFLCCLTLRLPGILKSRLKNKFIESYQQERHISLLEIKGVRNILTEYLPVLSTILDLRQYTAEELFAELFSKDPVSRY